MPEIAEIARIVHYIKKNLVGKTLAAVQAADDPVVYGKVGTSAAEFQKAMTGKKVLDAGQQGKYFWMVMSSPPHPVMHFGMTGWLKMKSEETYYYKPDSEKGKKMANTEEWPPKYWKFILETAEKPKEEVAFVDPRRFARIRLVDCKAGELRNTTPLKENGPDPVQDSEVVTVEWLKGKCMSKKVPIKAMLLDQAVISGIGNWVGDEVMYDSKIHPEQYCNTLSEKQIKQLHESIHYVCKTAVDLLADSDQFPEKWLFKHRWGKGKKDASSMLPSGEKITFLTVGGRTSCVVPSVQKKTGPVAGDVDEDDEEEKPKAKAGKKRKTMVKDEEDEDEAPIKNGPTSKANGTPSAKKGRKSKFKEEIEDEDAADSGKKVKKARTNGAKAEEEANTGRRKSGRVSRG